MAADGRTRPEDPEGASDLRREWDLNPRWAYTHNGFRDRPIRPLSHPSDRVSRLPPTCSPVAEEALQQFGCPLSQHPTGDGKLMVEPRVDAKVVQRAARPGLGVGRPD